MTDFIPVRFPDGNIFQRGAKECQAWDERVYLTAIIRLRLRRAEKYPS